MFAIRNAVARAWHYKLINYPKNGITKMQSYAKYFDYYFLKVAFHLFLKMKFTRRVYPVLLGLVGTENTNISNELY